MKTILVLGVVGFFAAAFGQTKVSFSLPPQRGDMTLEQALGKAEAFLTGLGETAIVRKEERYYLDTLFPDVPTRVYHVLYRGHHIQLDAATGMIYSYQLSSAILRKADSLISRRSVSIPTRARAEQISSVTAGYVGLPPNARRVQFDVQERNPQPGADSRGFFSVTYVGSDRSNLQLVFDRKTGRLESLFRAVRTKISKSKR